jgi:hypothetical protein
MFLLPENILRKALFVGLLFPKILMLSLPHIRGLTQSHLLGKATEEGSRFGSQRYDESGQNQDEEERRPRKIGHTRREHV